MCEFYVKVDLIFYELCLCFLCICGVVIILCLENQFWDIFWEIVEGEGLSINQLIINFYEEVMDYCGEVFNFVFFLCVSCICYLVQWCEKVVELSLVGQCVQV